MLEKNEDFNDFFYFDAHFHYSECKKNNCLNFPLNFCGISCAHNKEEFFIQQNAPTNIYKSYGLHPQNAEKYKITSEIDFLEYLLKNHQIDVIGEIGFDFFTNNFKQSSIIQEKNFNICVELAIFYKKSIIIHCRKANEKLFEYSTKLRKTPCVIFHSFMGNFIEAKSLLNRGINGYFSFGKQILNNNKKAIENVKNLPIENILFETDAPFQTLKNEKITNPNEIKKVYKKAYEVRSPNISFNEFCVLIKQKIQFDILNHK